METKAAGATSNCQYKDFEPIYRWHRGEGQDILEIDVKGFKEDQLKVNATRILTIHGERPIDASKHKWSRFHKEIRLSNEINAYEVSAKLSNTGVLFVVMPKMVQLWNTTPILEAKIGKRTAIEVAIGAMAVLVMLVAIGTYICCKSSK